MVRSYMSMSSHAIKESDADECQRVDTGETSIEDKEKKIFVIPNADTIIDPGAMV